MKSQNRTVSAKASPLFDEQFPDVKPGFETDDGRTKAIADFECSICGRRTLWFHLQIAVYLCSQDCLMHYQSEQP